MRIKFTGEKDDKLKRLYSDMLDILAVVGIPVGDLPSDRRREKMAGACLATGQIKTSFKEAKSVMNGSFLKTRDIIEFENTYFGENISSGSYDDIRRKDLKILVEEGLVVNSSSIDQSATNNPNRGYALDAQFANLIKTYGTKKWGEKLSVFLEMRQQVRQELAKKREMEKIPVTLPSGVSLELTMGEHNLLQKKVIEEFLPRWGMGAKVLYIGDSTDKYLFRDDKTLESLHFFPIKHEELPDIVAYSSDNDTLFLIEAVHSSGPMDELRVKRLKKLLADCTANIVFFTTFLNRKMYQKYCLNIAWETEVWIAEVPDHLVHLNGEKFLKIYQQKTDE